MRELGIDLADRRPQPLTTDLAQRADVVVTMGCGDACPYIPGKTYLDWDLADPKSLPIEQVRARLLAKKAATDDSLKKIDQQVRAVYLGRSVA